MPQRTKANNSKFASYLTDCWDTAAGAYWLRPGRPSVERLLKSSSLSTPSLGSMAGCDLSLTHRAPQDTHSTPTTLSASLPLTPSTCSLLPPLLFVPLLLLSLARLSTLACPLFKLTTQSFPCSALSFLPPAPSRFPFAPWGGTSTRSLSPGTGSHCGNAAKQVRSRLLRFFSFFLFFCFAEQAAKLGLPRTHLHKHPPTVFTCYGGD